jgi:hypothetical protein
MARADSGMPLTAEARVQIRTNLYGIYGGNSSNGADFSLNTSVFPCQYHFANPSFLY